MSDTKAIRPEIKGLFDTIRQQAVQYAESFEKLENSQSEYDLLLEKTKRVQKDLSESIKNEIYHLRGNFSELSEVLKIEQLRISQTYSELKDLKHLQKSYSSTLESIDSINKSLEKQSKELNEYHSEYQKFIDNLQETTNGIIEQYVNSANEQIDSLIKKNLSDFDKKVSVKVRELERRLEEYDKSISSGQNNSAYNMKIIIGEISSMKDTLKKLGSNNLLNLDKLDLIDGIKSKLDDFENKFSKLNVDLNDLRNSGGRQASYPNNSNSEEFAKFNLIKKDITELEKKHNLTMSIGITALLISVVGITLVLML